MVPVIPALAEQGARVSVDTMRAEVAAAALDAGAVLVNDVSGGLADPAILRVVAERGAAYVAMHWRGHAEVMQQRASYADVVGEVRDELAPPGRGRAGGRRRPRTGWWSIPGSASPRPPSTTGRCCGELDAIGGLGLPILVGSSRKSFLGALLADPDGAPRPVLDREDANVALTTLAGLLGVWAVRVHEVRASVDALKVVARWQGRRFGPSDGAGKVVEDD